MAQFRVEYTIGLGQDEWQDPITDEDRVLIEYELLELVSERFDGGTVTMGEGFWIGPDGDRISEPVMVVCVDYWGTGFDYINEVAEELASIANQTCVHVATHEVYAVNVHPGGKVEDGS